MNPVNRRTFVQLSAGALLFAASAKTLRASETPSISSDKGTIRVVGATYSWEYKQTDDRFTLFDSRHRMMVSGKLQPAVVVSPVGSPTQRVCTPGKGSEPLVEAGKITFTYSGVNGNATLKYAWRFDVGSMWTDPIQYESQAADDLVSLHYFAESKDDKPMPTLHPTYAVVPGVISGSTVSPILHNGAGFNQNVWLGRGSFIPGLSQQWALPVHYFCGFSTAGPGPERNLYTEGQSDAFCCGLADLPQGDYYLQIYQGSLSPWVDYRSDLWGHVRTPGNVTLGGMMHWSFAPEYREAITAYYEGLLQAGVIQRKHNSAHKTAVALTPQFCTWGAQRERDKANDKLDEAFLTGLYGELKASGMKAGLYSIDDKWEGAYGNLVHSAERLPHFEQFLDKLRAEGVRIGMWAAVMRCERPADLGLTNDHMLKQPDGTPFIASGAGGAKYAILDFTQPEVARVLTEVVRRFMRRYKPDLFKFDFGYELPTVAQAAPKDRQWTGERLLWKGLDVVIKAMRAENPDIVVMYYNLSPLFLEFIDLHSPDDMWMDIGDYQVEANRRLYFSGLMGKLGVPTYGSSGYDWSSSPSIWFDSAATGSIGCLNDFGGDEQGEVSSPELIAKYNGIAQVLRPTTNFEILPLDTVPIAPTMGAHARSWARMEDGQLVLLARRPDQPGEEDLNTIRHNAKTKGTERIKGLVRATVPVIVASKTNEDITRSSHLALVAYGGGEVWLKREVGKQALVTSHYFGGQSHQSTVPIVGGQLKLDVLAKGSKEEPLEWVNLSIS